MSGPIHPGTSPLTQAAPPKAPLRIEPFVGEKDADAFEAVPEKALGKDFQDFKPGTSPLRPELGDAVLKAKAKTQGLTGTVESDPNASFVRLHLPDGQSVTIADPPELVAALKAAASNAPAGSVSATVQGDYTPPHIEGGGSLSPYGGVSRPIAIPAELKATNVDIHAQQTGS